MPPTLPYTFDTTPIPKLIFKGSTALGLFLLLGVPYAWFIQGHPGTALFILLLASAILYTGLFIFRKIGGSSGLLTAHDITVTPATQFGFQSDTPGGHYPLTQFRALLVEKVVAPTTSTHATFNRVSLLGHEGTPTLRIAGPLQGGLALAQELSPLLNLPIEEQLSPY